jgi:hypothetical protein
MWYKRKVFVEATPILLRIVFQEITMNIEAEMLAPGTEQAATPSADFINAISRFLDTNPDDLLVELGYYSSDEDSQNTHE